MAGKGTYRTRQRAELVEFLRTIPGRHVTASEICTHFREQGKPIGTATVYRQLERMLEEGLVRKYLIDENSGSCFEYIDPEQKCPHPVCHHCKCERCGRLIHLECRELNLIQSHLLEEHGFLLDPTRTVFYGVCEACRNSAQER